MNVPINSWATMHSSVYREAATLVRRAAATTRAHGALRYQCPVTNSMVLITDEAALAGIAHPRGRLCCMNCGEVHLLTQDADTGNGAR